MGNGIGVFRHRDVKDLSDDDQRKLRETTLKWLINSGAVERLIKNDPSLVKGCQDEVKKEMGPAYNTLMEKMRSRE